MNIEQSGKSNGPEILARLRDAQTKGLIAAGNVLRNAIRRRLRGGYRSSLGNHGDWVTGASLNHVTLSTPTFVGDMGSITVGTDLLYNLFWELGHHNIFTKHFERDERWRPAFKESVGPARAAFERVFVRSMAGA